MAIIEYITINLLLFFSWYVLLFRYKDQFSFTPHRQKAIEVLKDKAHEPLLSCGAGFADRVLGTFVLCLAQIVLTEMVLGILFKQLYAAPLFIMNLFISLGVLVFTQIKFPDPSWEILREIFKEFRDAIRHFFNIIKGDWMIFAVFILFFISLCYLVFIGYLFPSYSWDALLYHLPTIGFILQSGAIENIPYNSLIYIYINVIPKNIDLFFLWNVIFLKSDVIVDLSQLPFTAAGIFALYSIAVKLGVKERYAVYSSLLLFFAPIVILQSTANYVDVAVSVLFLIAINFLTPPPKAEGGPDVSPARWALVLSGVAAGILLGSKGSGPLFILALSTLFFISEIRRRLPIKKIVLRYVVYSIVPVILLGGYWYINNWVYYGNPVYPIQVSLFGKTLFRGIFTEMLNPIPDVIRNLSPLVKPFYVWLDRVEYYYYASDLGGFGPLWLILFLPALVFSFFYAIRKKSYDFPLITLIIIFVFILYPMGWTPRYVIFVFGLGALSFGVLLECLEKRERALRFLAVLLVIYSFITSNSFCITSKKIKEFVHLSSGERTLARMEPCMIDVTQREEYGLWAWISNNISEGETLAYTFTPAVIAPLWNSSFSNKIIYVKAGNFNDWIKNLEVINADYVLILGKPRSIEHWWITRLWELRQVPEWSDIYKRFSIAYADSNYLVLMFYY